MAVIVCTLHSQGVFLVGELSILAQQLQHSLVQSVRVSIEEGFLQSAKDRKFLCGLCCT